AAVRSPGARSCGFIPESVARRPLRAQPLARRAGDRMVDAHPRGRRGCSPRHSARDRPARLCADRLGLHVRAVLRRLGHASRSGLRAVLVRVRRTRRLCDVSGGRHRRRMGRGMGVAIGRLAARRVDRPARSGHDGGPASVDAVAMMARRLTIADPRERAVVAAADALLWPAALMRVLRRRDVEPPKRLLCFRLERIGDLLMTAPALAALRALLPGAQIDLVVGSWNRDIAGAIPGVDRVETLDAAWLARGSGGLSPLRLAAAAARGRRRRYGPGINFEPDIRTNIAVAAAGARRAVGFASAGGGPLLDVALDYDTRAHTTDNAMALVQAATGLTPDRRTDSALRIPESNRARASSLLAALNGAVRIGLHVSGGRAIKQWPAERFRDVARRLVNER